jgi:ribosomal protein L11 methyltransferase
MSQIQPKHSTRVEILVEKGQEELLTDKIYQLAGKGFWLEDQDDFVLLKCYPDEPDAFLENLSSSGLNVIQVNVEREEPRDYAELTRQYFRPIRIDGLTIRAPWNKKKGKGHEIIIEPGMAFGTGRHESTRIMIKLMNYLDLRGKTVLDIGCGSGILALYAHILGAGKIIAVDNDQDAIDNGKKNIKLNEASEIEAVCSDLELIRGSHDIVLANLDINTFNNHSTRIVRLVKDKGCLVISGILGKDRKRLLTLFSGYRLVTEDQKNAWRGFIFEIDNNSFIR